MSIKVLLADDSEIVRRGIRNLLRSQPEIELVGEAADFRETIQMMNELNPQVIVLDLYMPDGTEATIQRLKSHLNQGSRRYLSRTMKTQRHWSRALARFHYSTKWNSARN